MNDETRLFGFYTTRRVKARSPDEAVDRAITLVQTDQELLNLIDRDFAVNPHIFLDQFAQLGFWSRLGGSGYSFFSMESE